MRVLPVAVLLVAVGRLAWSEGGSIAAADWLPTAILLALLVATPLLAGAAFRPSAAVLAGSGALLGLAAWDALSAAWSPVPSLARDEALLAATYALALLLPALLARPAQEGPVVVAGIALALGGLAVATGLHLLLSGGAADVHDGRLAFPVGYPNADAALFLVGLWPAVALAAGRRWRIALRISCLVAATAILACWAASQSKGAAAGLVVATIVVLAVSRARLRLVVPLLLCALPVAVASPWLTEPYREDGTAALADAVQNAGAALLLATLAALGLGYVYVFADKRITLRSRQRRLAERVALGALVAAAGVGAAAFLVAVPHPGRWAEERWHNFKRLPAHETGQTHLLSLGSNRYDFWRVAIDDFERHPLAGVGARGFQTSYLLHRRSDETPARAHSAELDALGETGLFGLVLLVAGVAFPLVRVARRARNGVLSAGILGSAVLWSVHASVDWIWTFPVVTIPVFLLLGVGCTDDPPERLRGRAPLIAGCASIVAALVLFAPPWVGARLVDRGLEERNPNALRWAKRLDPLSTDPYIAEAALTGAPGPLRAAVRKEPDSAALHYALGLAYERVLQTGAARRELERALALDPREELIRAALRRVAGAGST